MDHLRVVEAALVRQVFLVTAARVAAADTAAATVLAETAVVADTQGVPGQVAEAGSDPTAAVTNQAGLATEATTMRPDGSVSNQN